MNQNCLNRLIDVLMRVYGTCFQNRSNFCRVGVDPYGHCMLVCRNENELSSGGDMSVQDEIYAAAIANGCTPKWYDGILGWRCHCMCPDYAYWCHQRCSH